MCKHVVRIVMHGPWNWFVRALAWPGYKTVDTRYPVLGRQRRVWLDFQSYDPLQIGLAVQIAWFRSELNAEAAIAGRQVFRPARARLRRWDDDPGGRLSFAISLSSSKY